MKNSKAWGWRLLAQTMLWMTVAWLAACSDGGGDAPAAPVAPAITAQPADTQVTAGSPARFSVTADGADLIYQWQRSNDGGATWAAITGATSASYTLATPAVTDSGSRFRVLVSRGTAQTISSAVTLTVNALVTPPSITVQPQPVQVTEGGDASFSVTATGTALAYRWQTSPDGSAWTDASAGTTPTLTLNAVPFSSNQLQVRVLVSNSLATATSNTALLTVQRAPAAPQFTTQPAAVTVVAPNTATFTVVVSGTPTPTLQWQRSTDGGTSFTNITGATATSYTTAATSVADTGTRYRAVATNTVATVNSSPATLTVTPALVPAAVTTEPADATVVLGAQATFSVVVSGNPAPALQWQISTDGGVTFANINGATSASYTLTTTAADNGRRLRVVATNSLGTATSRVALLTVTAPPSGLSGRVWTGGQLLDSSLLVQAGGSVIDSQGRLTVAYGKVVTDRLVLHVVRGTPGAAGTAPVFSTPLALEAGTVGNPALVAPLAVSPSGNVAVLWSHGVSCGSSTCYTFYVSRYMVATGQWDIPAVVGNGSFATVGTINPTVAINDSGDLLVQGIGTVYWRANGAASFGSQSWPLGLDTDNTAFVPIATTLDGAGRIVVAGQRVVAGLGTSNDLAVYRGDVRNGLGAVETVDQRGAAVTFKALYTNPAGQSVVLWSQDNGVRTTVYAATVDTAGGSWAVTDTGQTPTTNSIGTGITAALADDGSFILYSYASCTAQRRTAGTWGASTALPSTLCLSGGVPGTPTLARNGNLITLVPSDGSWLAYDARLNQVFNPFPHAASGAGYLLGFAKPMSALPGTLLLADNGIGAYVSVNSFSVLPTAALPNGDSGPSSLWILHFK